ncbi:hypothetical protein [Streptomyces griseoflavus]|uniref:hypothetical protein n=1 Tax=Streptomyces griseoflavus TaxID=35619 RepID=UPI003D72F66B
MNAKNRQQKRRLSDQNLYRKAKKMNHCSASQLAENASSSCTRLILGSDTSQGTFPSTWTWTAVISLAALITSTYFSVYQIRKSKRAKQAKRFQPDYDLLDETVVLLDKLAGTTAHKADLSRLGELLSRIKQAAASPTSRSAPSSPTSTPTERPLCQTTSNANSPTGESSWTSCWTSPASREPRSPTPSQRSQPYRTK